MSTSTTALLPRIESRIHVIRGQRVMMDVDLATLYGVQTKRLNEQVKRNRARFPSDFLFQLPLNEKTEVAANCDHLKTSVIPAKAGIHLPRSKKGEYLRRPKQPFTASCNDNQFSVTIRRW